VIEHLSAEQVLALQAALVREFGGAAGLRDAAALEAAVARPAMTFGGEDLYSDAAAKAAALMHSLVLNHPFIDGNKRTGIAAAELFLILNGHDLAASDDDLETLTLQVAHGGLDVEPLTIWFRQRLTRSADE
jgi:death-on-curing protein